MPTSCSVRRGRLTQTLAASLCLAICTFLVACGGGSSSTPALSSIAITPASPTLAVGDTQQLAATGTYSDGHTASLTSTVTWSSSASSVATVSSAGLVTRVAIGTATISAGTGGVSAGTGITVNPALVSIAVTPDAQSLPVNGTLQFTATGTFSDSSQNDITGSVTWSSSPGSMATINGAGLATGVAAGDTTITATSGSKSGSTTLTITPILVSITVTADDPIIDINTTAQFTATGVLSDGSAQDLTDTVTWAAPGGIASIDSDGVATGLAIGTTTVTATSGLISGSANLQVRAPTLVDILISPLTTSVPGNQSVIHRHRSVQQRRLRGPCVRGMDVHPIPPPSPSTALAQRKLSPPGP